MALSPEEIEGREFGLSRRGYDRDEVDDFLLEVADTVRQAEAAPTAPAGEGGPAGDDATHPLRSRIGAGRDTDEYALLGEEVAAVLRTADEGAARRKADAEAEATRIREEAEAEANRMQDEADGYAHRLRTETETETERIRAEAEVEARNARTALEEATEQARMTIQQAKDEAEALAREAEESAGRRRQELLAGAERQADQAASIERDVHGRLVSVRDDLDQAVGRLDPESTAALASTAAEQASALDPGATLTAEAEAELGQGPPTPPVPPPPTPGAEDVDTGTGDLPYAAEDEPLDEPSSEAAGAGGVLDLSEQEVAAASGTIPPVPPPPPPPPGFSSGEIGVAPEDLPYASEAEELEAAGDEEPVIDLRDDQAEAAEAVEETDVEAEEAEAEEAEAEEAEAEEAEAEEAAEAVEEADVEAEEAEVEEAGDEGAEEDEGDEVSDPLAAMVRDAVGKAVQGAMRRRPSGDR
jgi:DivIVA domain-containing protein